MCYEVLESYFSSLRKYLHVLFGFRIFLFISTSIPLHEAKTLKNGDLLECINLNCQPLFDNQQQTEDKAAMYTGNVFISLEKNNLCQAYVSSWVFTICFFVYIFNRNEEKQCVLA